MELSVDASWLSLGSLHLSTVRPFEEILTVCEVAHPRCRNAWKKAYILRFIAIIVYLFRNGDIFSGIIKWMNLCCRPVPCLSFLVWEISTSPGVSLSRFLTSNCKRLVSLDCEGMEGVTRLLLENLHQKPKEFTAFMSIFSSKNCVHLYIGRRWNGRRKRS